MRIPQLPSVSSFATLTLLMLQMSAASSAGAAEPIEYSRDIRPILARNCFACHGPDADAREADLRLDQRAAAVAEREGRWVIKPGSVDESQLIARIDSEDPDLRMPPPDSKHRLTQRQRQLLRQWIAAGAPYQTHWAFQPPRQATPPQVSRSDWVRGPLDRFVLAKMQQHGLQPSEQADPYRLIRRVSLDLTGLPPSPEEADAFAADPSDAAYAQVVDRLLASEAYGERWARMWLDLARYADTKGYEKDRPREIWPYRDWVIDALNRDMPFDQFTREQLAGDLLPNSTHPQQIATAFHRNTMTNEEGGTDDEEFRVAAVKDRVDTTLQVWMGLTMGCAKCHSHKYDPISQQDYYAFYAFFNQTEDRDREAPLLAAPTAEQSAQLTTARDELTMLRQRLKQLEAAKTGDSANAEKDEQGKVAEENNKGQEPVEKQLVELRKEVSAAEQRVKRLQGEIAKTPVMRELPENKRRETRIHRRGNFLDPGKLVEPAVPTRFGPLPPDAPKNRLGVVMWLTHPDNPLTARVMVNRVWARLFGVGLVATEEDFGTQGALPSHPKLLDWLAVEFRQTWSWKQLMRTIVLSSTYRQAAVFREQALRKDPTNRWLSRGPRFRLSAETIRDQALAVSGLLTRKVGGPSVMPPQPDGVWKSTYSNLKWENASGPDRYRRGLYTYWKRTSPHPAMMTFDTGSGEYCLIRRVRTNTPLQALVALNDIASLEAAGGVARRMKDASTKESERLTRGFRLVLIRPPNEQEQQLLQRHYRTLLAQFRERPDDVKQLTATAGVANTAEDASLVAIASILLNLDETLMR